MLNKNFKIGGELAVHRLGFGAMRVTGPGIWGPPADRDKALQTLRRLPELGIDFIDTADSYGPEVSEQLIREALHPYRGIHVATKAGLKRPGPDQWQSHGDPDYLIGRAHRSRQILGVDCIALWQLHRIDPAVPRDEQFAAVRHLLDDGVIRYAGLSEVSVEEIRAAQAVFPVATVQNRYNLFDRASEDVLDYCETEAIGFIPWFPLGSGQVLRAGNALETVARQRKATQGQVALAWLLRRSPVVIAIPGTSSVDHLEENARAASIELDDDEFDILDRVAQS
ncbi:aldo/keto reductase [Bradyrhizobium tunisiense]|uniref:aldo/keto reductase n=1 Tax=Bradyrhizobium tunisiense TaxID=3278709 RepID=UPI0035D61836